MWYRVIKATENTAALLLQISLLFGFSVPINAHSPRYLTPLDDASSVARRFQDVALTLTRDLSSDRRHAIDLYWEAYGMGGSSGSPDELRRSVGTLYEKLKGSRVGRLSVLPKSWEINLPKEPLIFTQGQPFDNFLLIIRNQTTKPKVFSIDCIDSGLEVREQSVSLVPNSSNGVFLEMTSHRTGNFRTAIRIKSETGSINLPLEYEVRRGGELQVRILDPAGRTSPGRVFLNAADGFSHTPEGKMDRVMSVSGEHYFYTDGQIRVRLPEGKARIEVTKGFDYLPATAEIEIKPDEINRLELRLQRLAGMNDQGWYSGDEHIHGNYMGPQIITPADNLLIMQAEDLNVGNLVVSNSTGEQIHDEQYFEAKPNVLSQKSYVLTWNQELRTYDLYGHLIFGNLTELVRPLYTGFPGTQYWEDYPSNHFLAMKAKAQGGYTAYAHPTVNFDIPVGSGARESVVDVALGSIDALEVFCTHNEPSVALWYRFLNCGFKLGISAGSDAFNNQRFALVAGGERAYVYTGAEFTLQRWFDGLAKGRAFATVGPLLFFEVEGRLPGEEFQRQGPSTKVTIRAKAISYIPMSKLEIVANGEIIKKVSKEVPTNIIEYDGTIEISQSAWIGARVWGPEHRLLANVPSRWAERRSEMVLLAHSGVSYVHIDRKPIFSASDRTFFIRWIDKLVEEVRRRGKFSNESKREEVITTFLRARRVYEEMGN